MNYCSKAMAPQCS